jgi:hypothetical protein
VSEKEATFRINIEGNAASMSKDVAASARTAAKAITSYEDEVKALSADLRRLRGNSDDVVSAKAALKKRIDEAKGSASALTAELIKQGVSYKAAAAAAKEYGNATTKLPNLRGGVGKLAGAVGGALGPVGAGIKKKLEPVTKKLGEMFAPLGRAVASKLGPPAKVIGAKLGAAGKAVASLGSAVREDLSSILPSASTLLAGLASGAALAAAAVVAVGAALIAGAVALAAFGLGAADAAAKMARHREALLGTAKDAGNLGDHIGQLAGKVPQGVAELNELSLALSKTRINGKSTVDALNAIAQVSGAVDGAAGAKIQELITRGDKFGRMSIGMFELDGTGLDFDSVAKEYAAGTKKSVEAARRELMMGTVPIEAGAAALRKAAEKKFGDMNIKNAFSLENAPKKLGDALRQLSAGVVGPISKALQDAFGQLDENAPLGSAIKTFMTTFGTGLVEVGAKALPIVIEGLTGMVGLGLELTATFLETKNAIVAALNGDGNWFEKWQTVGLEITKGLVRGIYQGNVFVQNAIWDLGKESIKAFKQVLGIRSPSKVFASFGEHTTEGYAQGVERGSKRASGAVEDMISMPGGSPAPALAGGAPITVQISITGVSDAKTMQTPGFLNGLSRAISDGLAEQGLVAA